MSGWVGGGGGGQKGGLFCKKYRCMIVSILHGNVSHQTLALNFNFKLEQKHAYKTYLHRAEASVLSSERRP